jgi:hypothetical protein
MKAAGPEAVSKIWMAIGQQVASQMQSHMMAQVPDAFRPFFNLPPTSGSKKA